MTRTLIAALAVSIAIHACVALMAPAPAGAEQRDEQQDDLPGQNISAVIKESTPDRDQKHEDGYGVLTKDKECSSHMYYTGIGVIRSHDQVSELAAGGPADMAGIQVGDVILNGEILQANKYEVGKVLVLQLNRSGSNLTVHVTVDRICYD